MTNPAIASDTGADLDTSVTEDTSVQPIGDAIDEAAQGLFGTLDEPMRSKARYQYLVAKIRAIQGQGRDAAPSLFERLRDIEEALTDQGITPSSLI